jgi:hypothetical protein
MGKLREPCGGMATTAAKSDLFQSIDRHIC